MIHMLRMIFRAMLHGASAHYGDSIGLSPIALASPKAYKKLVLQDPVSGKRGISLLDDA